MNLLGDLYKNDGDFKTARKYYEKALKVKFL